MTLYHWLGALADEALREELTREQLERELPVLVEEDDG